MKRRGVRFDEQYYDEEKCRRVSAEISARDEISARLLDEEVCGRPEHAWIQCLGYNRPTLVGTL
jgi:hypothetical protein